MDPRVREKIDEFLKENGLRKTSQRDAIVEAAFSTTEHYTAEDLLVMARNIDPDVSRATVYRTLPLLVKSGLLKELDLGRDHKFYDPNFIERPNHNHLICIDCDKIVEFEDTNINLLEDCISRRLGFSPSVKMIRIEANCEDLKQHGTCPNRKCSPDEKPARKNDKRTA
jgi:Fur family ferric uptake transcriptional regulator